MASFHINLTELIIEEGPFTAVKTTLLIDSPNHIFVKPQKKDDGNAFYKPEMF